MGSVVDDLDARMAQARKEYGEFINAGSTHLCPGCHEPTVYQLFSGGREWYCGTCDMDGQYPDGRAPSRAALLTTTEGRAALRDDMRTHLESLKEADRAASDASAE